MMMREGCRRVSTSTAVDVCNSFRFVLTPPPKRNDGTYHPSGRSCRAAGVKTEPPRDTHLGLEQHPPIAALSFRRA